MTTTNAAKTVYLKDYQAPKFEIQHLDLHFDLQESFTRVSSKFLVKRLGDHQEPLVLFGEDMQLESVAVNESTLSSSDYQITDETLTINPVAAQFEVAIVVTIKPHLNTQLSGLYQSKNSYCTQCESHGFRRMTYFLDRPDVMTIYTTTIVADKTQYPVLLSNGNRIGQGDSDHNRHWVSWHDPFKKPSYLFALVAGDLVCVRDHYVTMSGRTVNLEIYVEKGNEDKCDHAMLSLKKSMQWDEKKYGREYDLDIYMIVAVSDFNMGAMENKGLNVFNTKYVLAKPETATDTDFDNIEGVIGHEYFHNWTGNRITCRDWFQLTLKEGLTVFRDECFSADMTSQAVKRINDVNIIRTAQFAQDAGPMAHPIRPESYMEINNFYTVTVYNKGAEVIRMIQTIVTKSGFRKGMDLYFERHDGQAVTTEDFVKCMEDANDVDLTQFKLWYSQAGTPEVEVQETFDRLKRTYTLTFKQSCPPTPESSNKQPFHIPIRVGLLDHDGDAVPVQLIGETSTANEKVLHLTQSEQSFTFHHVSAKPFPSIGRQFSAPVKYKFEISDEKLAFLFLHDSDTFNRWNAGQQLAVNQILRNVPAYQQGQQMHVDHLYLDAFRHHLETSDADLRYLATLLTLPSVNFIAQSMAVIDPDAIFHARKFLMRVIASSMKSELMHAYTENNRDEKFSLNNEAIGRRCIKNLVLEYLLRLESDEVRALAANQYHSAHNMTDRVAVVAQMAHYDCSLTNDLLAEFYQQWLHEPLVIDKWFAMQAASQAPSTLENLKKLIHHPVFNMKNPNKVYALVGTFINNNLVRFHEASGAGYEFLADQVITINAFNPQVAARIVEPLTQWKRYNAIRQQLMKAQLQRILESGKLSKDVYEIASKGLNQ